MLLCETFHFDHFLEERNLRDVTNQAHIYAVSLPISPEYES
jgi:hypothetical protein